MTSPSSTSKCFKVKFSLQLSKVDKCIARTLTQTEIIQSRGGFECVLARIEVQYFHILKIRKGVSYANPNTTSLYLVKSSVGVLKLL